MIIDCRCYERDCKHYLGVKRLTKSEVSEVHYCTAFPNGIPESIIDGDNLHLTPTEEQENKIVFEELKK